MTTQELDSHLSHEGLLHHDFRNSNTNAEKMATFFTQLLVAIGPVTSVVLSMDDASFHQSTQLVTLPDNVKDRFLLPYSPFFNICENAFSCCKAVVTQDIAAIRHTLLQNSHHHRLAVLFQIAKQII